MITPNPAFCAISIACIVSVSVPIWFTLRRRQLAALVLTASSIFEMLVTVRSTQRQRAAQECD